jgi:hypothetical protein
LLVLKSGNGNGDPDWVSFLISSLTGTWNIVSPGPGQQTLSHASLYGVRGDNQDPPPPVPLPPALFLFGTALIGLTVLGRRRRGA